MGDENQRANQIAITPSSVLTERPKVTLDKDRFDTLVKQKGYPVRIDRTIKCPCASIDGNQAIPGCRNCGGSGWVAYNVVKTNAIIHSMNRDTQFKEWSEEMVGTASFTTYDEIKISYMDKVTLEKGYFTHTQKLNLKQFTDDDQWRVGLTYPPLSIESAFLFESVEKPLILLTPNIDYIIDGSVLTLTNIALIEGVQYPKVSVRYTHRPEYLVIDMLRNTISSLSEDPATKQEGYLQFPIHAVIRLTHYLINEDSNDGTHLYDNSFAESGGERVLSINGTGVTVPSYTNGEIPTLTVQNRGLIIYNETIERFEGWNGVRWVNLSTDSDSGNVDNTIIDRVVELEETLEDIESYEFSLNIDVKENTEKEYDVDVQGVNTGKKYVIISNNLILGLYFQLNSWSNDLVKISVRNNTGEDIDSNIELTLQEIFNP